MAPALTHTFVESPVGPLLLVARGAELVRLHFVSGRKPVDVPAGSVEDASTLPSTREQLTEYFNGTRRVFDVPLALEGTAFQRRVWTALCEIPYGETISYGQLARRIGQPTAVRAVGLANGSNPIAIIVPCHRVIGANGTLTGYGGGLPTKARLLDLEKGAGAGLFELLGVEAG